MRIYIIFIKAGVEMALNNVKERVNFIKENSEREMKNSKMHVRRSLSNKVAHFEKKKN